MGCGDEKLSKYLTQTFTAHCNAMICQQVTLSGDAEWPKVADAVIEAASSTSTSDAFARQSSAKRTSPSSSVHAMVGVKGCVPYAEVLSASLASSPTSDTRSSSRWTISV